MQTALGTQHANYFEGVPGYFHCVCVFRVFFPTLFLGMPFRPFQEVVATVQAVEVELMQRQLQSSLSRFLASSSQRRQVLHSVNLSLRQTNRQVLAWKRHQRYFSEVSRSSKRVFQKVHRASWKSCLGLGTSTESFQTKLLRTLLRRP